MRLDLSERYLDDATAGFPQVNLSQYFGSGLKGRPPLSCLGVLNTPHLMCQKPQKPTCDLENPSRVVIK